MTDRVLEAHARFNEMNALDPNKLLVDGVERPKELVFAERLEEWVLKVDPEASTALRLAARCQHLERWAIPRSDYPEGRVAYLKWRKDLAKRSADRAAQVLQDLGFEESVQQDLRKIMLKQELKTNKDSQAIEDALCLSFLEHEYAAFSAKHEDEKVVDIVQKTWRKMSADGHDLALQLPYSGRPKELILQALKE